MPPTKHQCEACILRGRQPRYEPITTLRNLEPLPRTTSKRLWWTTGQRDANGNLVWECLCLCDEHLPEFQAAMKYEDDVRHREQGWPIPHYPMPPFMGSREIFR